MLHDGNKVFGDVYSEETIKLIRQHLLKSHIDGDNEGLVVRFNRLMSRVQDQEISHTATWDSYLKILKRIGCYESLDY